MRKYVDLVRTKSKLKVNVLKEELVSGAAMRYVATMWYVAAMRYIATMRYVAAMRYVAVTIVSWRYCASC